MYRRIKISNYLPAKAISGMSGGGKDDETFAAAKKVNLFLNICVLQLVPTRNMIRRIVERKKSSIYVAYISYTYIFFNSFSLSTVSKGDIIQRSREIGVVACSSNFNQAPTAQQLLTMK